MTTEGTRILRNGFYASIGFGVLAFQKVQVRRRELESSLKPQVDAVGRHLRVVTGHTTDDDQAPRR